MTKDDIIRMARESECEETFGTDSFRFTIEDLERFAKLVVANIDPKSFMSWQEGYDAGVVAEREACAGLLELRKTNANSLIDAVRDMEAAAIRARTTP